MRSSPGFPALLAASLLAGCLPPGLGSTVVSDDGLLEVSKPGVMRVMSDLHEDASIQLGSHARQAYFVVLTDPKMDLEDGLGFRGHSRITRSSMKEAMKGYEAKRVRDEFFLNGMKGCQYRISGTVDGVKIVYLHTTLESSEYFHQVLAWSVPSKFKDNRPLFRELISSFKER